MFDNLLYIFSKENEIINNYITDTESIREVKKLKHKNKKIEIKFESLNVAVASGIIIKELTMGEL